MRGPDLSSVWRQGAVECRFRDISGEDRARVGGGRDGKGEGGVEKLVPRNG